MNLFLIGMTGLLRRKAVRKRRILLASLAGSAQMTGLTLLWLSYCVRTGDVGGLPWRGRRGIPVMPVLLAAALFVAWEMLQISFRERLRQERLRNLFSFFQVSILTGGALLFCWEWLGRGLEPSLWLVILGTAGVFAVLFYLERMVGNREQQHHVMDGVLYMGEGEGYPLRVLLDTGNQLVSPYSGERVMILSESLAQQLELSRTQKPLWIPFHSIGGEGLLPAYRIPALVLQNGSELRDFLAAVSPELSADPTIQMILHSEG